MNELDKLDDLAAEADLDKNAPAGTVLPDANPEPQPPGPEEQALDLVNGFAGLLVGYAPDTATIWTPEARASSAAVIAPLMVKYNFSLMAIPPELTAAIVVGPLLYRSATIVGEKIKADRAAKVPEKGAAPPPPGAASPQPVPGATENGIAPAVPAHPQMALYKP